MVISAATALRALVSISIVRSEGGFSAEISTVNQINCLLGALNEIDPAKSPPRGIFTVS